GPQAEIYVGWHTNTDNPESPAAFALIDQYRKENYRPDLLAALVRAGNLDDALKLLPKPAPPPKPDMTVWLEDIAAEKSRQPNDGEVLVREAPKTLRVRINNLPPINEVEAIEYQVNDGAWRPLKDDSVNEWTGDLTVQPWKPGHYRLRARLTLRRGEEPPLIGETPPPLPPPGAP